MNPANLSPVLNHLWQSTLFAGVAWLLTLTLRNNGARVRHGVWLAASCKFLIPLSMLIGLGTHVPWRTAAPAAHPGLVVVDEVSRPFSAPPVSARMPPQAAHPLPEILSGIWAFGFAGIAISWCIRYRRIRQTVHAGYPVETELPVRAASSPVLLEPGVFGVFRPVLLLPEGIANHLTPAQFEAVVAHELCHIRHRDNLVAALHMFVESVFWFHPLVWWIGKRMVAERERACDEEVLRLGSDPRAYAAGILGVCRLYAESPLACVSGVTGSDLSTRIEAIMLNRRAVRMSIAKRAVLATAGTAALAFPLAIGMLDAPRMEAQPVAAAGPKFAVASVKPCRDTPGRMRGSPADSSPGRLSTGCDVLVGPDQPLGFIQRAYVRYAGGHPNPLNIVPIKGGPPWIHTDEYEINARAEGSPSLEMMQGPMLQALLEDRFQLKLHRETKQGPVYALTAAKGGPRLKPFQEGSCVQMPLTFPLPQLATGQRYCKALISLLTPGIVAEGSTLTELSKLLNLVLDRPVINRTGLTQRFDIHLAFARDQATPGLLNGPAGPPQEASEPMGPTIFTAIQEQLGLKLEPAQGPLEYLVIDHVERPTEN